MIAHLGGWIEWEDIVWPPEQLTGIHTGCGGEVYDAFYEGGGVKCRKCRGWHCL